MGTFKLFLTEKIIRVAFITYACLFYDQLYLHNALANTIVEISTFWRQ